MYRLCSFFDMIEFKSAVYYVCRVCQCQSRNTTQYNTILYDKGKGKR